MKRILVAIIGQILGATVASSSTTGDGDRRAWLISELVETAEGKTLVLIDAGVTQGLDAGMIVVSYRGPQHPRGALNPIERSVAIETGVLKIKEAGPEFALAEIVQQGSFLSKTLYPKFPGIMSGDSVLLKPLSITARKYVTPEAVASYFSLFADPKSAPSTFELSPQGMEELRILAEPFLDKRAGMVMVEGHTDHHGSAEVNQIESYQRALTVRQYLVEHLGFDPKRVLAIGYGEGELIDESMIDGAIERNRRIVLKITSEQ